MVGCQEKGQTQVRSLKFMSVAAKGDQSHLRKGKAYNGKTWGGAREPDRLTAKDRGEIQKKEQGNYFEEENAEGGK